MLIFCTDLVVLGYKIIYCVNFLYGIAQLGYKYKTDRDRQCQFGYKTDYCVKGEHSSVIKQIIVLRVI